MQENRLGEFRLKELLGEGSMGRVWKAEQLDPHRDVAIKVTKYGSDEAVARFRNETQLLASMAHPNIASLYTVGKGELEGATVHYFAMECVVGVELRDYCERHALSVESRLRLIAKVARAVHHAHSRGVIHRDLKPSNVLVTAEGEPKILDFGIARSIDEAEMTRMTAAGEILGTLPYMSPEQLSQGKEPIGPATDVYALGVMAYQLMSGEHPFPGLGEMTVLSAIATLRSGSPKALSRATQGVDADLETIVMKAVAPDLEGRYDSALELATDIERWLRHEPISARPPTAWYTLRLFVRRHRVLTSFAAGIVLVLLGAVLVSTRYAASEASARADADARASQLAAVNDFIIRIFTSAAPSQARGRELTVVDLLDSADSDMQADTDMPDVVRGTLARTLAVTYLELGASQRAEALFRKAVAANVKAYGHVHSETIMAKQGLSQVLNDLERIDESTAVLADLVERGFPPGPEGDHNRRGISLMLGVNNIQRGRGREALAVLEPVVAEVRQLDEVDPEDRLSFEYWLVKALDQTGQVNRAVVEAEDLLARCVATLGDDAPSCQYCRGALASIYTRQLRFADATPLLQRALDEARRTQGEDHPGVAGKLNSFAEALVGAGRYQEALEAADTSSAIFAGHSGVRTHQYLVGRGAAVEALMGLGRLAEAAAVLENTISVAHAEMGEQHVFSLHLAMLQGDWYHAANDCEAAKAEWEQLLRHVTAHPPADRTMIPRLQIKLAECAIALGHPQNAESHIAAADGVLSEQMGVQHPYRQRIRDLRGLIVAATP